MRAVVDAKAGFKLFVRRQYSKICSHRAHSTDRKRSKRSGSDVQVCMFLLLDRNTINSSNVTCFAIELETTTV